MKKTLSIILSILITAVCCSCTTDNNNSSGGTVSSEISESAENSDSKITTITEDVAINSAKELIPEAEYLYTLYFRCKADTEEYDYNSLAPDENGFRYAAIKDFNSISAMKEETEKYFTADYCEKNFYKIALNGDIPFFKDEDGVLKINVDAQSAGENTWNLTAIEILSNDGTTAKISVPYTDIYDSRKRAEFTLVLCDDGNVKINEWVLNLAE